MWLNDDFTTNDFTSIVNISKEQKERFSFRIQWESLGDNEGRDTECFLFSSYTETQKLVQEFVWVFLLWSDPPACTSHVINQRTLFSMIITAFPKKKAICQAIWKRIVEQIWEITHIYDLKLQYIPNQFIIKLQQIQILRSSWKTSLIEPILLDSCPLLLNQ